MRDILFRAKAVCGGWFEGGYYENNTGKYIITPAFVARLVIPETVCQFTGLTDKNGRKIFEGDILGGFLDEDYPEHKTIVTVEWHECMWVTHQGNYHPDLLEKSDLDYFEVIGNIYDNPELLKGGEKHGGRRN